MTHSLSSSETNSSLKASSSNDASSGVLQPPQQSTSKFAISLVQECSAVKKGLLWEQQQNRFFFNRWKERFFILTTDYLTCFKKGSKKVGMSEMGSFVYKVCLFGTFAFAVLFFIWNDFDRNLFNSVISLFCSWIEDTKTVKADFPIRTY